MNKAIARLNQHHGKAASILEQASKAKDADYDHLMQALEKTKVAKENFRLIFIPAHLISAGLGAKKNFNFEGKLNNIDKV